MNPYDSYMHLISLRMLAPEDYEAASKLWDAYRRATKRAKRMEYMLDVRTREFEAALERESSDG